MNARTWSRSATATRRRPRSGSTRPRRRCGRSSPTRPSRRPRSPSARGRADSHVSFRCGRGREQYLADIDRSQAELAAGESYEVCLTDQISTDASPDPFDLYRLLRRRNPAPFAAYLKLGEMAVVSSSPERFLSVDRERRVEARPIKGTTSRSADPERDEALRAELTEDEKTYAEHLMIVDLLRNDLGRVCEVGSVGVPELMVVEDYATVHQLISTVERRARGGAQRGRMRPRLLPRRLDDRRAEAAHDGDHRRPRGRGARRLLGGDRLVRGRRRDGPQHRHPHDRDAARAGRRSAPAARSSCSPTPSDEFDEILLKARAPMAAIAEAVTGSAAPEAWSVELEPRAEAAGAL